MSIVRELFAKLGLDYDASSFAEAIAVTDLLKAGLEKAAQAVQLLAGEMVDSVVGTAAYAGAIKDMSQQTGIATTTLQELDFAAKMSGGSLESLVRGFEGLARRVSSAQRGSKEQAAIFAKAGVDLRDAAGNARTADDVMADVADRIASMPDGLEKTALVMNVFGRSGAVLIPLLNEGGAGIRGLREEAHQLGLVLDEEAIENGDRLADSIDRLTGFYDGLKRTLGAELVGEVATLVEGFVEWAKANREVIRTAIVTFAQALIAVLRAGVAVVKTFAENIRGLAFIFSTLLTAALVKNGLLVVATAGYYTHLGWAATVAGLKAAAAWLAAIAPVAALVALLTALALMAEDVYVFLQGGDSLIGELGPKWTKFLDEWLADDTDDGWFMTALKAIVWMLSDITERVPEALNEWKKIFGRFFDWIGERVRAMAAWIGRMLDPLVEGVRSFDKFVGRMVGNRPADGSAPLASRRPTKEEADFWTGWTRSGAPESEGATLSRFGGGASPVASAQTSAQPTVKVNAPQVNAPITINQQPGQDAGALADEVERRLEDALATKLREADAATR